MIKLRFTTMFGLALSVFLVYGSASADVPSTRTATVTEMLGQVSYRSAGAGAWMSVTLGTVLTENDTIKTDAEGTCTLLFTGMSDATIEVRPNTVMELKRFGSEEEKDDTELELLLGNVLVKAEKLQGESEFQVRTPNSIVGIRGTEFEVGVD